MFLLLLDILVLKAFFSLGWASESLILQLASWGGRRRRKKNTLPTSWDGVRLITPQILLGLEQGAAAVADGTLASIGKRLPLINLTRLQRKKLAVPSFPPSGRLSRKCMDFKVQRDMQTVQHNLLLEKKMHNYVPFSKNCVSFKHMVAREDLEKNGNSNSSNT